MWCSGIWFHTDQTPPCLRTEEEGKGAGTHLSVIIQPLLQQQILLQAPIHWSNPFFFCFWKIQHILTIQDFISMIQRHRMSHFQVLNSTHCLSFPTPVWASERPVLFNMQRSCQIVLCTICRHFLYSPAPVMSCECLKTEIGPQQHI